MHVTIQNEQAWLGAPRFVVSGLWTPHYPAVQAGSPSNSGVPSHMDGLGCDDCGLGMLGAATLTPTAAVQQAIQDSSSWNLNPRDWQNPSFLAATEADVVAGQFNVAQYSASCAGQSAPPLNLFSTASGIGLSATAATTGILAATHMIPAVAVPVIGWVVAGVGALVGLISAIFQHHAAAVRRDLSFGCSALPAVNNALSVIAQGVASGNIKPGDAAAALDQIVTEFHKAGGAAINYHPYCNSNCEQEVTLKAMVLYWKSQYAAMHSAVSASAAQPAAVGTPTQSAGTVIAQSAAAPAAGGLPSPLMIIGALVLGAFLLR